MRTRFAYVVIIASWVIIKVIIANVKTTVSLKCAAAPECSRLCCRLVAQRSWTGAPLHSSPSHTWTRTFKSYTCEHESWHNNDCADAFVSELENRSWFIRDLNCGRWLQLLTYKRCTAVQWQQITGLVIASSILCHSKLTAVTSYKVSANAPCIQHCNTRR